MKQISTRLIQDVKVKRERNVPYNDNLDILHNLAPKNNGTLATRLKMGETINDLQSSTLSCCPKNNPNMFYL